MLPLGLFINWKNVNTHTHIYIKFNCGCNAAFDWIDELITFIAIYGKCHLSKKNKSSGITLIILVTNILSKRDNSKSIGAGT